MVLARRLSMATPELDLIAQLDLEATFAEDPFVPAIGDTAIGDTVFGHTALDGVEQVA